MAPLPKIGVGVAVRAFSPPNVVGGRVASGSRNVASVHFGAVEEASPKGGVSQEEEAFLFHDFARAPGPQTGSEPPRGEVSPDGLNLGSVFQVQESLGQGGAERRSEVRIQEEAVTQGIRSYQSTQKATDGEHKPVGEILSIKL